MFNRLRTYLAGATQELKAVKWPTQAETRHLTIVVLIISLLVAGFLGGFDYIFTEALGLLIG